MSVGQNSNLQSAKSGPPLLAKDPNVPVSGVGNNAGDVRVEAHRKDEHIEGKQEPVVDEFVIRSFGKSLETFLKFKACSHYSDSAATIN